MAPVGGAKASSLAFVQPNPSASKSVTGRARYAMCHLRLAESKGNKTSGISQKEVPSQLKTLTSCLWKHLCSPVLCRAFMGSTHGRVSSPDPHTVSGRLFRDEVYNPIS